MEFIIAGILAIAGAVITAGVTSKQQKDAQAEARELSGIQREDELEQRRKDELASNRALKLGEQRTRHDRRQAQQQANLLRQEEQDTVNRSKREALTQAAGRLKQQPVDSFLFKKKNVERFGM